MNMLAVRNLTKNFGGLSALSDINLHVEKGEILGIIGPNGSGKSTLLNLICGVYRPTHGEIIFEGENIENLKQHEVAKKGIARVFQETIVYKEETVLDNVLLGFHLKRKAGILGWFFNASTARKEEGELQKEAREILNYMRLCEFGTQLAKNLPYGHQRALGVSIALALYPKLLLLDEPVTGMNPSEVAEAVNLIKGLRDRGITLMLIEHNMAAMMDLSDRIIVLNYGRKIAEGIPKEIKTNKEVVEAYLGAG